MFLTGVTFFGYIAYGVRLIAPQICNPAAEVAISGITLSGPAWCIGTYVIGAACASISAVLSAEGASSGWQWWKESGVAKRNILLEHPYPAANLTLASDPLVEDHVYALNQPLGKFFDNITGVPAIWYDNEGSLYKRDGSIDNMLTWSINYNDTMITTIVHPRHLLASAEAFKEFTTQKKTFHKRGNAKSGAMDIGNMFVSQIQPCTDMPYYSVQSKFCASFGDSSTPGIDSIMVGEVYVDAYGGIDNECQTG
ncbi:hypothetical protein RI543_002059 [Arxiozyma heterogenica]|uniref:Uncharacterized protein n=1 Tax=Arxiozyma heterogenica TaxID=278026 RepID=A0AAN7W3C0_9SACH|nr:hypothetical protein RI543_002059 [Kazachstania heterogenica]